MDTTELRLHPRKGKVALGGGVMLLMWVGLWLSLRQGPNPESVFPWFRQAWLVYPLAIVGLVLTSWLMWCALMQIRKPTPRAVLNAEGVTVNSVMTAGFHAPWQAFTGYRWHAPGTLVLLLKDAPAFVARQAPGRHAETARALSERFGSPFLIEPRNLAADAAVIERFIAARLAKV